MTIHDPNQFPATLAVINAGIADGLHLGAQVYAAVGDETEMSITVGEAAPGTPLRANSIVPWMSNTKPIGAVAIGQLVLADEMDWNLPVAEVIPEFEARGKSAITVKHILTHTAGLNGALETRPGEATQSYEESVARVSDYRVPDDWVVGETAAYDPYSSWYVVSEIVQRTTEKDFSDYVQSEILGRLNISSSWLKMSDSEFDENAENVVAIPTAGTPISAEKLRQSSTRTVPHGGARGPISDLGRIYQSLLNAHMRDRGELLPGGVVRHMTSRHRERRQDLTMGFMMDWGLGFTLDSKRYGLPHPYGFGKHASDSSFGHGGMQSSGAFADPEKDVVVAYYFNGMPGEAAHHRRSQAICAAIYEDLGLA